MDDETPIRRDAPPVLVRRAASMAPATFDEASRSVDVVFTTGAEVMRTDYWSGERWVEALEVSANAVDLSRLNAGAPVLNTHSSYDLGDVIGVVERAWIEGGRGYARLRFSEREEVAPIIADVRSGILRNISVGYSVSQWMEEDVNGQRRRTATRWLPMEVSLVPIPADQAAQVRSAAPAPAQPPAAPAISEESVMDQVVPAAPAQPDAENIRSTAVKAERARIAEIQEAARAANLDEAWVQRHVDDGSPADVARRAALGELSTRRGTPQSSVVQIQRDEGDTLRQGIEGMLEARLAGDWSKATGPAAEWRSRSLVEMGAALLRQRGIETNAWSRSDIARAMLGLPVMSRTMQTTSDFPALLANVQSKRLMAAYDIMPRSFLTWCARRELPDFKSTTVVDLGAAPALSALAEGGQITYGVMGDSGESYQLVRYARNVSISYPAIVNDDLSGFDRVPAAFATATANLENAVVYGILETNAVMSDGVALFAAGHANTSAQSMDVAGVTALRTLIMRQTDPSGQRIMVSPTVIITPPELTGTALALFSGTVVPAGLATTQVNPWRGQFEVAEAPFLTDANDYFMTVRAGTGHEAVEVGYEAGSAGPQLTSFTQPDVDGLVFSLRHSFGAKAVTHRTIARATA
jgi:hypothetical protein